MRYDGHDRQTHWYFPSKTSVGSINTADYEQYGYDAAGNRTHLRKRDGLWLGYQYDALNRVIRKTVPERSGLSSTHTRDVFYGYDVGDRQVYARFDSHSGEGVTNAYDSLGRLTGSTINMDGVSRTLTHALDVRGRRTRLTFPDGAWADYTYDALDLPKGIYDWGGAAVNWITYDAAGRPYSRGFGWGSWGLSSWQYDGIGRTTRYAHSLVANNHAFDFTWTPASQIRTLARSNPLYSWDDHQEIDRAYAVNGLNQYTDAGPADLVHDANGNLTSIVQPDPNGNPVTTTYTYDVENRLVSAAGPTTAQLRYDPLGRLYETSGGAAGTTRFLYDGDALVAEYTGTGTLIRRYVHAVGTDTPLVWYEGSGATARRWMWADHLGSIFAVTDGTDLLHANTYDEWGIPGTGNAGRFQYTGQAWIPELGMYHYKARIYSPTLGRFLQTDPIGYEDQMNLYAYVGNDPTNRRDPTGWDNCEVVPGGTKDCIGDEDADPDTPEENESREEADDIVVTARRIQGRGSISRHMSDDAAEEWAFRVDRDGLSFVPFRETRDCRGDVKENVLSSDQFEGSLSGGHTHPAGYESGPGPHDGNMAAVTGRGGYIISPVGRSVVERVGGSFRARLLSGGWGTSRSNVRSLINAMNENPEADGTDGEDRQCQ